MKRAARKIRKGEIATLKGLQDELAEALPRDELFKTAFATKSIRNKRQLRYVLLGLERKMRQEQGESRELIPNMDEREVDLEHIMPRSREEGTWQDVSSEDLRLNVDRIGNVALLRSTENRAAGRAEFAEKREYYQRSQLLLTSQVGEFDSWDIDAIAQRQEKLAELAVRAFPL